MAESKIQETLTLNKFSYKLDLHYVQPSYTEVHGAIYRLQSSPRHLKYRYINIFKLVFFNYIQTQTRGFKTFDITSFIQNISD